MTTKEKRHARDLDRILAPVKDVRPHYTLDGTRFPQTPLPLPSPRRDRKQPRRRRHSPARRVPLALLFTSVKKEKRDHLDHLDHLPPSGPPATLSRRDNLILIITETGNKTRRYHH